MGGDIFSAWRQLVPGLPALAFLAAEGGMRLQGRGRGGVFVLLGIHLVLANTGRTWPLARADRYEWDVAAIADTLVTAWGDRDPLIAVDAAGALPYGTGFRALDMLGLNDAWAVEHPPAGFGGVRIGHDLGDPDYVMAAKPDLVAFNSGLGSHKGRNPVGRILGRRGRFRAQYPIVLFSAPSRGKDVVAWYHIRREGGAVSVVRTDDRIEVPGWFLASPGSQPARLIDGVLATPVSPDRPGRLPALPLPAGAWRVSTEPVPLPVGVRCGEDDVEVSVVDEPYKTKMDWFVAGTGVVERLVFTATDDPGIRPCVDR